MIIGQDNSNVPNVIKLFADAFAKSSIEVNSVVGQRMVLILRHVQVSDDRRVSSRISLSSLQTIPAIFQTCMNILTEEERQALANALNSTPAASQPASNTHLINHHASV